MYVFIYLLLFFFEKTVREGVGVPFFHVGEERGERRECVCAVVYLWQGAVDYARGGSLLSMHRVFKSDRGPKKEPSAQSTR